MPLPMPSTKVLLVISLSFGHGLMIFLVNVITEKSWNDKSEFDENSDKSQFHDYEAACERVKAFYKEQHGQELMPNEVGVRYICRPDDPMLINNRLPMLQITNSSLDRHSPHAMPTATASTSHISEGEPYRTIT